MSDIRFHTLAEVGGPARLKKCCALIEQAFLRGERVLVWLEPEALAAFDNLLWTFGDKAFVPHEMLPADPASCEAPVQLCADPTLPQAALRGAFHTLVMLRVQATADVLQFATVIEVVDGDPTVRNAGRARFRFYRDQGQTPQHLDESNSK